MRWYNEHGQLVDLDTASHADLLARWFTLWEDEDEPDADEVDAIGDALRRHERQAGIPPIPPLEAYNDEPITF